LAAEAQPAPETASGQPVDLPDGDGPLQQNTVWRYEQNLKWVAAEEGQETRDQPQIQVEEPELEKVIY